MTTEKKKRAPKPAMTPETPKRSVKPPMIDATRWLIEKALPVFEGYSDSWADHEAYHAAETLNPIFDEDYPMEKGFVPLILDAVRWGKTLLQEVLRALAMNINECATSQDKVKFYRELGGKHARELVKEGRAVIDRTLPTVQSWHVNSNGKVCLATVPETRCENIGDYYKALIADGIFRAVDSKTGENALYYVGCCPRCGKIFEKKRGDQEYCGRACATASAQKTYDQKRRMKKDCRYD